MSRLVERKGREEAGLGERDWLGETKRGWERQGEDSFVGGEVFGVQGKALEGGQDGRGGECRARNEKDEGRRDASG